MKYAIILTYCHAIQLDQYWQFTYANEVKRTIRWTHGNTMVTVLILIFPLQIEILDLHDNDRVVRDNHWPGLCDKIAVVIWVVRGGDCVYFRCGFVYTVRCAD